MDHNFNSFGRNSVRKDNGTLFQIWLHQFFQVVIIWPRSPSISNPPFGTCPSFGTTMCLVGSVWRARCNMRDSRMVVLSRNAALKVVPSTIASARRRCTFLLALSRLPQKFCCHTRWVAQMTAIFRSLASSLP